MAAEPPCLDSLLKCSFCIKDCDDPRVLTCLHSLCRKCLDQHISTSVESNHFLCPSCGHKCVVPAGGAMAVPRNFLLNSLKEIIEQQASGEMTPASASQPSDSIKLRFKECANSAIVKGEHGDVTVYCAECAKALCSNCESNHQAFADLTTHRLLPVTNVEAGDIETAAVASRTVLPCDQHPTLQTDMYCDTCRVPVCWKCCLLKHTQHHYREIDDAANESKTLLSNLVETANTISSGLYKSMQELKASESTINADCNEACRQVQENAEEIRTLVTIREKHVVQEIRQAQTTALAQLNTAHKEAEINKAAVESLLSYIQALLASENATNQVVHAPGIQEQLRQHKVAPLQSVTLEVNLEKKVQSLSALNSMLGAVTVNQDIVTLSSPGGAVAENSKVSLDCHLLEVVPKVGNAVSGLAMVGDCVYSTGWCQPYLWMHNLKTSKEKRHTFCGLKAAGMTLVGGDTLVITDYKKRLHRVKINQDMDITEHVVKDIPLKPSDVSFDSAGRKLILVNYTDNQIVVCDVQGKIENRIKVQTSTRDMRTALATTHGYVVLDGSGELCWVSRDGAVEHTYTGDVKGGRHVVQDSQGRVIIADLINNRVHMVGVNKQLSQYLLTAEDGIKYPTCLYLDEANARLVVGCHDRNNTPIIRLYKWPFASGPSSNDCVSGTHHKLRVKLTRYQ